MKTSFGAFSLFSVGTNIDVTGFGIDPTTVEFFAGPRNGSSAFTQDYKGFVDETGYQGASSLFDDGTHVENLDFYSNDRCIYIREFVGGVWVTRVHAVFGSFITDGIRFSSVIAADSNFPIWANAFEL